MTQPAFGQVAPISRRVVAYIIDALIAGGIGIVLTGVLVTVAMTAGLDGMLSVLMIGGPVVALLLLGWLLLYTAMQAGRGSIGMRAQGLRLARADDGAALGFGRALLRNIIFGLAGSIVVGYFSPLFDGSGRFQGWHDKVAGSLMLDARGDAGTPASTANASTPGSAAPGAAAVFPPVPPGLPSALGVPTALPVPPVPGAPPVPGLPPAQYAAPHTPQNTAATPPQAPAAPAPAPAPAAQAPASAAVPPATDATVHPASPPAPPAPESAQDSLIAFVPGVTQDGPPPRPQHPAPPVPAAAPAAEETQLREDALASEPAAAAAGPETIAAPNGTGAAGSSQPDDIEDTRISIPGHRLVFTWDDGTRVSVSRRTIFGRNPAAEDGAVTVPVRDETLSLSKTHFEAGAEPAGGWVLDRHSTNGTTLVRDGQRIPCLPGERVRVRLGDALEIGDRIVTIGGYA